MGSWKWDYLRGTSGVLVTGCSSKLSLFLEFVNFYCVNAPTMADFQLSIVLRTGMQNTWIFGSSELVEVISSTLLIEI